MECVRHFALLVEYVDATPCHHLVRILCFAPTNVHRCNHVEEQVGGNAAGIIPILAETEESVSIIRALTSRTQPHFPIQVIVPFAIRTSIWFNRVIPFAFNRIAMVGPLAQQHLSQHAISNRLLRLVPLVSRCGLRAHLHHSLRFLNRIHQPLHFRNRVAHRLFAIDVFACVHRRQCNRSMPVVWSGHNHRIHILAGDHFFPVQISFRLIALRRTLLAFFVDVADGYNLAVVIALAGFFKFTGNIKAASTHANYANVNLIVSTKHSACATFHSLSCKCASCGTQCRCAFKKISTIHKGPPGWRGLSEPAPLT